MPSCTACSFDTAFARRIRDIESRSGAAATRIVALTANAFPADRAACFAAGFSAFVSKPLAQASLLAAEGMA